MPEDFHDSGEMMDKKIAVLATLKTQGRCTNWRGWKQVLDAYKLNWRDWDYIQMGADLQEIQRQVREWNPDIVLLLLNDFLRMDLKALKEATGCLLIFFCGDYHLKPLITPNCEYLDYMFISNEDQVEWYEYTYKIKNVFYMPTACYLPDPGHIEYDDRYRNKMVFVGNILPLRQVTGLHAWRSILWSDLKRHYKDRLENINEMEYPARNDVYDQLPVIYSSSMYSLNLDARAPRMRGYTSNRIWAILNFGGLCVTNAFEGMESLGLIDGETCIVFRDVDDFKEKVQLYDNSPKARQAIRAAGRELGNARHTHFNRFEEMMDVINLYPAPSV